MTVYVDDMHRHPIGRYRGMKMSHMIADTDEELLSMADTIGVHRKWHQNPGTPNSHFDIAMTKRSLALANGAIPITYRQCAFMCFTRRKTGILPKPETTEQPGEIA